MLDDIIVTDKSDVAHLDNRGALMKRIAEKNLQINVQKCRFFMERIAYCGHEIDNIMVLKTDATIEAERSNTRPQYVISVRGFPGLVNYYRRFLRNMYRVLPLAS